MILNTEELKQAIHKQLGGGESIHLEIEARFQRATGLEAEGLLAVTPLKLIFGHRPPLGEAKAEVFSRAELTIVSKEEDIWGASIKLKVGAEVVEFRRMQPSDFKQFLAELGETPEEAPHDESLIQQPIAADSTIQTHDTTIQTQAAIVQMLGTRIQTQDRIINDTPIGGATSDFNLVPAPPPYAPPPPPEAYVVSGQSYNCYIHRNVESKGICDHCGKPICTDCTTPFHFKTYCPPCLLEIKAKLDAQKARKTESKAPPPPPFSQVRAKQAQATATPSIAARSPGFAFLLSFILPGFGQFYNKQFGKGFFIFILAPLVIPWIWGWIDAPVQAKKHNTTLGLVAQPAGFYAFLLIVPFVIAALLIIGFAENRKNEGASKITVSQRQFVRDDVLPEQRAKVKELMMEFCMKSQANFDINKRFLSEIAPATIALNNTQYQFELVMLGDNDSDYRLYAWAPVGQNKELDLWSIGSGSCKSVDHEYGPNLKP